LVLRRHLPEQAATDIADRIVEHVPDNVIVSEVVATKHGMIDVRLAPAHMTGLLRQVLEHGARAPAVAPKRVVVDFSSPNMAKQLHVGHLRSTIIGDTLARMLEFSGHAVLRLNHMGDWGTPMGMVLALLDHTGRSPPARVADLHALYQEAKQRFDTDPRFKARALEEVVKLQAGDRVAVARWRSICQTSRRDINDLYTRLGVKLLERGESFYQPHMTSMMSDLAAAQMLQLDDGRQLLWPAGAEIPLILAKSDGAFTYDTSDLACLRYRVDHDEADWIIYVVDAGQTQHLQGVFSAAVEAGYMDRSVTRVDHVEFGVVLGPDKKRLKSRAGTAVLLAELLDEAILRAEAAATTLESARGVAVKLTPPERAAMVTSVAYGCVKYADLSQKRTKDYAFSFDRMLAVKGNTAVYLLYTYARIQSILNDDAVSAIVLDGVVVARASLEHPTEQHLIGHLVRFTEVFAEALEQLGPHILCDYVHETAIRFTGWYGATYCIERNADRSVARIHVDRLLLCKATGMIMATCFDLLGIETIDKM
jgi:arginyl-tRNA synthetase